MLQCETSWATFALSFRRMRHHKPKAAAAESTNVLRRKKSSSMPSLVAAAAAAAAAGTNSSNSSHEQLKPTVIIEEELCMDDYESTSSAVGMKKGRRASTQMYNGLLPNQSTEALMLDGRRCNSISDFDGFSSLAPLDNHYSDLPNGLLTCHKSRENSARNVGNWTEDEVDTSDTDQEAVARLSIASILPLMAPASDSAAAGLWSSKQVGF